MFKVSGEVKALFPNIHSSYAGQTTVCKPLLTDCQRQKPSEKKRGEEKEK
jgi:hypothetical protein